jgi:hypothetical protein
VKVLRLAVLAGGTALVLYVGARLALAAGGLADNVCNNTGGALPGWAILLACVAFFGLGHLAAGLRHEDTVPRRRAGRRGAMAAHLALALFFLFAVGAMAYETVGVWTDNPWGLAPITHYVRCAKSADPLTTMLVASTISFFAGQWLWFPRRRRA